MLRGPEGEEDEGVATRDTTITKPNPETIETSSTVKGVASEPTPSADSVFSPRVSVHDQSPQNNHYTSSNLNVIIGSLKIHEPVIPVSRSAIETLRQNYYGVVINGITKTKQPHMKQYPLLEQINRESSVAWSSSGYELPRQDNLFIFRKQTTDLTAAMTTSDDEEGKSNDETRIVLITGLGGIGKTQLALDYARKTKHRYFLTVWLSAESTQILEQIYLEFASALGYISEKPSVNEAIKYVKLFLSRHSKWLLIFDDAGNYKDIERFLPQRNGHVLITSRYQLWPTKMKVIYLDVMDKEEALMLLNCVISPPPVASSIDMKLIQHSNDFSNPMQPEQQQSELKSHDEAYRSSLLLKLDEEQEARKELVKILGYLPLAIAQAGAYINRCQIPTSKYIERYQKYFINLLQDESLPIGSRHDPIAITWRKMFETIQEAGEHGNDAALLLAVCSYLSSELIPCQLLLSIFKRLKPDINPDLTQIIFNQSLNLLKAYSLIKSDGDGAFVSMHRLGQTVVRTDHKNGFFRTIPVNIDWYNQLLEAAHEAFNAEINPSKREIIQKKLFPHLKMLIENYNDVQEIAPPSRALGMLLADCGACLLQTGNAQSAVPYLRSALKIVESPNFYNKRVPRPSDSEVANILSNLSSAHGEQGDAKEQLELSTRALAIAEQICEPNGAQLAQILVIHGNANGALGKIENQRQYLERALKILTNIPGRLSDAEEAIAMANLGTAYGMLGSYKDAILMLEGALNIFERDYSKGHPQIVKALINLANVYGLAGNNGRRVQLLEQAIADLEKNVDQHQPLLADALISFSETNEDLKAKRALLQRAYDIQKECYGAHDVRTIKTLNTLSNLHPREDEPKKTENTTQLLFKWASWASTLFTVNSQKAIEKPVSITKAIEGENTARILKEAILIGSLSSVAVVLRTYKMKQEKAADFLRSAVISENFSESILEILIYQLLKQKIPVDVPNDRNRTALDEAFLKGNLVAIGILIKSGANYVRFVPGSKTTYMAGFIEQHPEHTEAIEGFIKEAHIIKEARQRSEPRKETMSGK